MRLEWNAWECEKKVWTMDAYVKSSEQFQPRSIKELIKQESGS